jgi:hypothetical protein
MQNFGNIKNIFNNLLAEGLTKKDSKSKKLFQKYIKTIKESEVLKTQFLIYENIENKVDSDVTSANLFVSENLRLLEKYSKSDILKENEKLVKLIGKSEIKSDYELAGLHESLTNLIFTERKAKNIEKITTEIKNVSNYIVSNTAKEVNESVDLPMSMLTNILVDKFNEKYSDLSESDKKILRVLMNSNLEEKKNLYKITVNECVDLVNLLIKEADEESKDKLLKVKSKLAEHVELDEANFTNKFSKIIELKTNLEK